MTRRSHSGRQSSRNIFSIAIILALAFAVAPAYAQVQADFSVDVDSGAAPLSVQFFDLSTPQDSVIFRAWDLNGDGVMDSQDKNPRWTYEVSGLYTVTLVVADSAGYDTLRRSAFVNVAPVEEGEIVVRIRVIDRGGPVAAGIELWGYTGIGFPSPFSPISIRIGLDSLGYATFYRAKFIPMMTQNITDLHVLNAAGQVIGKTGFHFPLKELSAQRRKEAIVILHRDLVAAWSHPFEQTTASGWKYPSAVRFPWIPGQPALPFVQGGDPVTGPLYQTTMFVPPAGLDSSSAGLAQYRFMNIRPSRTPMVMLHGLGLRDAAWGDDGDLLAAEDLAHPNFNGKTDHVWTSYAGRIQQMDRAAEDVFDVWQYSYPPDQSWEESGYLFARDLEVVLAEYDSANAVAVAHGMGGLVLRSYLQGTARNFLFFGPATDTMQFRGDISRAVFLGTPHAGQLRAALAYGSTPVSPGLLRLEDAPLPSGVSLLSLAGSGPTRPTPLVLPEASRHDDDEVAISSAMLDRPTVWNGVIAGYSSSMLHAPDADRAGTMVPDPNLVPRLSYGFLLSDTTFTPLWTNFLLLHPPDSIRFTKREYVAPSFTTMRADIGVPQLRLSSQQGGVLDPAASWRLRLSVQAVARLLMEVIDDRASLDDPGMFLYPTDLCFGAAIQRALVQGRPALYAVSKSGQTNPLLQLPIVHDGFGWQLAMPTESFIANPVLSMRDDLGRVLDVESLSGDLDMHWSRATVSDLQLSTQAALIASRPERLRGITRGALDFTADCLTTSLSLLINHAGRTAPTLRLVAPDSSVIDAFSANDSTVFFTGNPTLAVLMISVLGPMQGTWRLELDGYNAVPEGCRLAVSTGGTVELDLHASRADMLVGDTLVATVRIAGLPVPPPQSPVFSCAVVDSMGIITHVTLRDDGITPDTAASDGEFAGYFIPRHAGSYRVEALLTADAGGCAIERHATRALNVRTGLELLAPQGGVEWQAGTTHNILWHGDGPSHISIACSFDGGATWTPIEARYPADSGRYAWLIPDITSIRCLLRIADADGWRADTSDGLFTIYERAGITVLSPVGGERWQVESVHEIRWTSIAVEDLEIAYSINSGKDWIPIASNIYARTGSWLWSIPVTPSDSCLVRMNSIADNTVFGVSPTVFSITPTPAVTLLSPNGRERWQEGSVQQLRWQSAAIDSIVFEYSIDDGSSWRHIGVFEASAGIAPWTVPLTPSDRCRVRATSTIQPSLTDMSDRTFSIIPIPRLRLLAPVGGEFWEISSRETIRWESAGIERVDIEYSTDNGGSWKTIAVNLRADDSTFVWNIPVEPTDIARVRIRDTFESSRVSMSPAVFSISESLTRPTLFAPADASVGSSTRPNFIWRPFFGAVNYHLQVSNDPAFGHFTFERQDLATINHLSPELAVTTRYFWRVRARKASGYTEWSSVWSFTTGASIFATPTLLLPFDGALGLMTSIQFSWTASDTSATWHLQVSEFPNFSSLLEDQYGLTGMLHPVSGFAENGDFFWRVRGGDIGSTAFGNWSTVFRFSTAPSQPRHLAPFDGMPDIPISPILQWYPVIDARIYRIQLARDHGFTAIVCDTTINASSLRLFGLGSYTTYYWRMNVTTGRGTSRWSDPWYFRTIDIGTSVEDVSVAAADPRILAVWPQPAAAWIHVTIGATRETWTLELFDVLGRRIHTADHRAKSEVPVSLAIPSAGLPAATYMLRLSSASGVESRLVIVGI